MTLRLSTVWLLAPLALAGCVEAPRARVEPPPPPTTAPTPTVAAAPAAPAAQPVAPAEVARDPNNPAMPAVPTGTVAQQQLALAAPTTPATIDPKDLRGLARADVAALLGEPDLDRREANAEALLYSGGGCVLHVFLYPQQGGAFRVDYAELGPDNRDKTADAACLLGLRKRGQLATR